MAGNDWEQQLQDKIQRLAGDDMHLLVKAAEALSHAGELTKKLFVNATDHNALKMVEDLEERRAGVFWQWQGAGVAGRGCGHGMASARVHAQQGKGEGVAGDAGVIKGVSG